VRSESTSALSQSSSSRRSNLSFVTEKRLHRPLCARMAPWQTVHQQRRPCVASANPALHRPRGCADPRTHNLTAGTDAYMHMCCRIHFVRQHSPSHRSKQISVALSTTSDRLPTALTRFPRRPFCGPHPTTSLTPHPTRQNLPVIRLTHKLKANALQQSLNSLCAAQTSSAAVDVRAPDGSVAFGNPCDRALAAHALH
jgi:hypothetical protein